MAAAAAPTALHTAEATIPCGGDRQAGWVLRAIRDEVADAPEGAVCTLSVEGGDLRARIAAADLAGLRASLNTVVRLADAALRTVQAGHAAGEAGPASP
jgi:tRNA threonylcarbamoyladenosine modification (KEOPS) complex  Pcc1 subunit